MVNAPLYDTALLRLAASIPHLGRLKTPHATVEKRSPLCGSRVIVDVRVDDSGRISALGLDISACALGQASANILASHAIGRIAVEVAAARDALALWLAGECDDPGDWPRLALLSRAIPHRGRHAAIRLPFEALADAATRAGG